MEVDECVKESAFDGKLPDEEILKKLTVPVPKDEKYRLKVLRETALLDSDLSDPSFDRFTALCQRIFNVDDFLIFDLFHIIRRFRYPARWCHSSILTVSGSSQMLDWTQMKLIEI